MIINNKTNKNWIVFLFVVTFFFLLFMIFSSNLLIISILFTLFIYELNTFVCVAISFTIVLCTIFFLFFRVNFGFSHIYTHKSQIIYYSIFLYIENQKTTKTFVYNKQTMKSNAIQYLTIVLSIKKQCICNVTWIIFFFVTPTSVTTQ